MEKKTNSSSTVLKIVLVGLISVLLLIPLALIAVLIEDRKETNQDVIDEVVRSYARHQEVDAPYFTLRFPKEKSAEKKENSDEEKEDGYYHIACCTQLNYKADVMTDVLHRSIYDVMVYNSKIQLTGKVPVTDKAILSKDIDFRLKVSDFRGLSNPSALSFGGKNFNLSRVGDYLEVDVVLPDGARVGDLIDFAFSFDLKGTESLVFYPSEKGVTSLTMSSTYRHPGFFGTLLPNQREVRSDGFDAAWSVTEYNSSINDKMGVKFVYPANPYQQSMRSAKYGILIVILVFVAGLFVEFITRKVINPVQYTVIGLSLVLFYSLLLAFSEFIAFGLAYLIAALMTTMALTLYFRGILKSRSAYVLGGFVALVYALNYLILNMETYALLTGSVILFLLLCVVMYLTANINNHRELPTADNQETL